MKEQTATKNLHWLSAASAVFDFRCFVVKNKWIALLFLAVLALGPHSHNIVALVALVQKSNVHLVRNSLKQSFSLKSNNPETTRSNQRS